MDAVNPDRYVDKAPVTCSRPCFERGGAAVEVQDRAAHLPAAAGRVQAGVLAQNPKKPKILNSINQKTNEGAHRLSRE